MPKYAVLTKYTSEALAKVRKEGYSSRPPVLTKAIESMGGKLESMYFLESADYDFMLIVDFPDADGMFGLSSFGSASGVVARGMSYELRTGEQADAVISRQIDWRPPGQS